MSEVQVQQPKLEDDTDFWKARCLQLLEENVKLKEKLWLLKNDSEALQSIIHSNPYVG